jgi:hypothetical protein
MGVKLGLLTLREEHRLRVFEKWVLRLFGLKRHKVMGGRRNLHNKEIHYSYSSIIRMIKPRMMRWVEHIA